MPIPKNPHRFFAIPVIGFVARVILLLPYNIYQQVIASAAVIGMFGASFPVLLKGRYPESVYELSRDAFRLHMSATAYIAGLSDGYPSFSIDLKKHQFIKIILIILGILWLLGTTSTNAKTQQELLEKKQMQYNYDQKMPESNFQIPAQDENTTTY